MKFGQNDVNAINITSITEELEIYFNFFRILSGSTCNKINLKHPLIGLIEIFNMLAIWDLANWESANSLQFFYDFSNYFILEHH
jgi:hypothetical protein